MSWSMSFAREIADAVADAIALPKSAGECAPAVEAGEKDRVSASMGGYMSWDDAGVVTASSTGHTVSVSVYQEPAPPVVAADAEAGPVSQR
ncbi:MAG TPA: hypothetical protein VGR47_05915 [Terracidiphilus sp.]|nr:hypothetical protein [Terracidiphilus sp.]